MAGTDGTTKFFEAVNESSDALIDAARSANDRNHRFAIAVIEEAQESQRELVELAKKWAANPLDILGFYSAVVDSTTKAQGRALDVARQWFGELADVQKETRDIVQRVANANRSAGEASFDVARGVIERTTSSSSTRNGDGRRAPRETAAKSSS